MVELDEDLECIFGYSDVRNSMTKNISPQIHLTQIRSALRWDNLMQNDFKYQV